MNLIRIHWDLTALRPHRRQFLWLSFSLAPYCTPGFNLSRHSCSRHSPAHTEPIPACSTEAKWTWHFSTATLRLPQLQQLPNPTLSFLDFYLIISGLSYFSFLPTWIKILYNWKTKQKNNPSHIMGILNSLWNWVIILYIAVSYTKSLAPYRTVSRVIIIKINIA